MRRVVSCSEPTPTILLVLTGLFIVTLVVSQARPMQMRQAARGLKA